MTTPAAVTGFQTDRPDIFADYATVTFEQFNDIAWLAIGSDEQSDDCGDAIIGAVVLHEQAGAYLGCQTCLDEIEPGEGGMCLLCRNDFAFQEAQR